MRRLEQKPLLSKKTDAIPKLLERFLRRMHAGTCNVVHNNAHTHVFLKSSDHVNGGLFLMTSIDVNDIPSLFRSQCLQLTVKRAPQRADAILESKSPPPVFGLHERFSASLPGFHAPTNGRHVGRGDTKGGSQLEEPACL